MLGLSLAQASLLSWLSSPPFKIAAYKLLSKTQIGTTNQYEYVYTVEVRNNEGTAVDVIASAASKRSSVTLVDDDVSFGTVPGQGLKLSNDTLVVRAGVFFDRRHDRKVKNWLGSWVWAVDGYDPPDFWEGLWAAWVDLSDSYLNNWYTTKLNAVFDWKFQVRGDATAPVISGKTPVSLTGNARPAISATYSDALAGVDASRTVLKLDGAAVSGASATATGVTYTPPTALVDGLHTVNLTVVDQAGNAADVTWTFTVDATAPVIGAKAPADTVVASPTSSITVGFSDATSGVDPTMAQLIVDGVDVSSGATKTASTLSYRPVTPWASGVHGVTLKVRDLAGNETTSSWNFGVDASAPTVSSLMPAAGAELAADAVPSIRAVIADAGAGVEPVKTTLTVDGVLRTAEATITATSVVFTPTAPLPEGVHVVVLHVEDRNGNVSNTTWSFTTKSLPVITGASPRDGYANGLTQTMIAASYSDVGSGIDMAKVALTLDGVEVTGQSQVTTSGIKFTPATLSQGAHQVSLTVFDKAGFSTTQAWQFTVDTIVPTVSDQQPSNVSVSQARPVVTATVQDVGSGVDTAGLTLSVDGQDRTSAMQLSVDAQGVRVQWQATEPMLAGEHSIGLSATDKAGNRVDSVWKFHVDTEGPVISGVLPAAGASLAADAQPQLAAAWADAGSGVDVATVKVILDGQDITATAAVNAEGFSFVPAAALIEGPHTLEISVKDKAGNASTSSSQFVTASLPQVSGQQPKGGYVAAAMPEIVALLSDVGAGIDVAGIRLLVDGADVTAATAKSDVAVSFRPTVALADGQHQVVLIVKDKAGNEAQSSWQFGVDATLPVVSQLQPLNVQVNTATPTISAQLIEAGSGLDLTKTTLRVNGIDVTAQAQFAASASPAILTYVPAQPLTGGQQMVQLLVVDLAGNRTEASWSFTLDGEPPVVTVLSPTEGGVLSADAKPTIQVQFADAGSGINVNTVTLELDGVSLTSQVSPTPDGFTLTLSDSPNEGAHALRVRVADKAGNLAERQVNFTTRTAPVITAMQPKDTFLPGGVQPVVSASYADIGAGIDTTKVRLVLNGTDVTAQSVVTTSGISYTVAQPLADATHQVSLTVGDLAGNVVEGQWQFATLRPPQITNMSPRDTQPNGGRPVISATFVDAGSGLDLNSARILLDDQDVTVLAQITPSGFVFQPAAPLAGGAHTVYVEVASQSRAVATTMWTFEIEADAVYRAALSNPLGGVTTLQPKIDVVVTASSNRSQPADVRVNGLPLTLVNVNGSGEAQFAGAVELIAGVNTLNVSATFADGGRASASGTVTYNAPPKVTITSPVDKSSFGRVVSTSPQDLTGNVDRPVKITGTVSKPVTSVTINQQAAELSEGGRAFAFNNFFLHEGMNVVTVVATDADGRTGTSALMLSVDQTAPILSIEHPALHTVTSASTIDVRGVVNDAVEGFAGAAEPTVTVNGVQARVSDRYYVAQAVPLNVGENTLTVVATDQLGNSRTQSVKVSRIAVGSNRLTILTGNHQEGTANTELAQPLAVVALDAAGQPMGNVPVSFDVLRGTGSISTTKGQVTKADGLNAARNLVVRTDTGGRAQVWLSLGRTTGAGANVVRAAVESASAAIPEDVHFTSTTKPGRVAKVLADLGINQFGEAGAQPLELMSVVVRDKDDNHLTNVPVTYTVIEGDAYFPGAEGARASQITLSTDKNGLVATRPFLGLTPGTVRVKATAQDGADSAQQLGNAVFTVQVKEAKDGPTSFKGFIYTDKGEPLPGVRLSVARTSLSSTTDEKGAFSLNDLPPGRIDLFVDGRTTSHQGKTWPSLHFEAYAVRGQENLLSHPVYLPPLAMGQAKTVGGNQDVILTMPGVEGFQMKVKANSVTFPDGSKVGTLVVSPVTADRLPMAPPAGGTQFGVPAWTLQPAGTRFDPPVEVTLPNTRAYPRGETQPVVQWDHDLSQFVPMGRATVSEDGSVLVTDAGSGVTKAGWGGLCVYDPDKCGQKAPPKCHQCQDLKVQGDCPTCVDKDPCKDDGDAKTYSVEFPEKQLISEKLIRLVRTSGIISDMSIGGQIAGERKVGNRCCKDVPKEEKCLGPYPYDDVSGKGTLKADVSFGPSLLNPEKWEKTFSWGPDRWRFVGEFRLAFFKFSSDVTVQAETKSSRCKGENCKSYTASTRIGLSFADVKGTGKVFLEERDDVVRKKWNVVIGAGAEIAGALKGGVGSNIAYKGGSDCSAPGVDDSKLSIEEIAIEGKFKISAEVPGIIWPAGGFEWSYKYVLVEGRDI